MIYFSFKTYILTSIMWPFLLFNKRLPWTPERVGLSGFEPAPPALVPDAPTLAAIAGPVCWC